MLYELPVAYQAKNYAHQQHGNREYGYTAVNSGYNSSLLLFVGMGRIEPVIGMPDLLLLI